MSAQAGNALSRLEAVYEPTQVGQIISYVIAERMRSNPSQPYQA